MYPQRQFIKTIVVVNRDSIQIRNDKKKNRFIIKKSSFSNSRIVLKEKNDFAKLPILAEDTSGVFQTHQEKFYLRSKFLDQNRTPPISQITLELFFAKIKTAMKLKWNKVNFNYIKNY